MNSKFFTSTILACSFALSACSGGSDSTPTKPIPVKKTIHVDNIDQTFSTYLLYRYRLSQELKLVLNYLTTYKDPVNNLANCSKQGTIQQMPQGSYGRFSFNTCQTETGSIFSGTIEPNYAVGPAKTTWYNFSDLSYQLTDDTEIQKLNGSYTENRFAARSTNFTMSYTNGTRTASYFVDSLKTTVVDIKTTAISGNQHFILTDINDKGEALTPILSADDGSNLSISFDNNGAAALSLRNEINGTVIGSKNFSKLEIDTM